MRFLLIAGCSLLLVLSGALLLLLGPAPYTSLQQMAQLLYVEDYFARLPLALTPDRYEALLTILGAVFVGSGGGSAWLLTRPAYREELRSLWQEATLAAAQLKETVRGFTRAELAIGLGLLLGISGLRLLILLRYGFRYDELVSYLFFVRQGPVVISCYYPLPNNHVFFNLCCTALQGLLGSSPELLMRLPSFGAATLGTVGSYALLTRFTNFKLATLVTGLFNLTPAALFYAASGRGYYLQLALMQVGFFAVMGLGSSTRYQRLGWLLFIGSSVLGLYTIPTYAYPLASLLLGAAILSVVDIGKVRINRQELAFATLIITAGAVLLYAPIGLVSGWKRLVGNSYVASASWQQFRALALANIYEKLNVQFGVVRPALALAGTLLVGTPLYLWRQNLSPRVNSLAWLTWAMLTAPVALVLTQRAYPPIRAVVYLGYFGFLLVSVAGWVLLRQRQLRLTSLQQWLFIAAAVVGASAARFENVPARIRSSQHEEIQLRQAWTWLRRQAPQQVYAGSYQVFFYQYALENHQRLTMADQPILHRRYDYLILPAAAVAAPGWARGLPYRRVYGNDLVSIFALQPLTFQ